MNGPVNPEDVISEEDWPDDAPVSYEAWKVACRVVARDDIGGARIGPIEVWPYERSSDHGRNIAIIADELLKEVTQE